MTSVKSKIATIVEKEDGEKEYCCVSCPVRTSNKEQLELHLVLHNKVYRFLCGICGTGLKRKEHLDRHMLGHQEVRPHVCSECGKGFKRKEHLNIHRSIHSGDKNQICSLCDRSFYRKDHLQKHLQTHNKLFLEQNLQQLTEQDVVDVKQELMDDSESQIVYDDSICDIMATDHITENTSESTPAVFDKERPFSCNLCNKTYKRKDHLKLHVVTHQKKDKICSECGKAFHRDEQLLCHMNIHLEKAAREFGEELTPPVDVMLADNSEIDIIPFENTDLLVPRMNYEPEIRPHECPICHRKFKRRQHLKVHANVHFKLQPTIWCSLCNAGFHNNDQFESHRCVPANHTNHGEGYEDDRPEMTRLDAKKENSYPPEFLQLLEGNNKEELSMMIMTEEHDIPTPQRVYVCKYCSKPFKRKDHYKIHLHVHTGVKTFFCPECGKGFYRKDHLQKHATIHMRVKVKTKKEMPDLFPIKMMPKKKEVKPEITITAPSNAKLRVPLQIKVPYQVVMSMDNGEQRAVTIDPQANREEEILS